MNIEINYKNTKDLIPYVNNSRTHSDKQVKQIASSIKEFGFTNPILVDEENGIIAGHGRLLAAELLNIDSVPTITLKNLTKAQKKAYVIADNKLALNSGWNEELLKLELKELTDMNFDITLTGFELDELVFEEEVEVEYLTDEDEVPAEETKVVSVLGDIWQLGNHRLMCGDSTIIDAVDKLIDNNKIDMVFTDPPYGINEKGDRSNRGGLCEGSNLPEFKDDTTQYAIDAFNILTTKDIPVQVWWGANYFAESLPPSANWIVWDKRVEEKNRDNQSDCELAWAKSRFKSVRIFRHIWKGMIKSSEHGIKRVHPTQKPTALAEWCFKELDAGNNVIDLFGGSGSTLIACEKSNKNCFMMEFEPYYLDVIIKRWQNFTGKEAIHIETGKTYNEMFKEKFKTN